MDKAQIALKYKRFRKDQASLGCLLSPESCSHRRAIPSPRARPVPAPAASFRSFLSTSRCSLCSPCFLAKGLPATGCSH
ncbi:hypothetical protein AV530_004088 [Patagioenas fasciata monilis]|uniref:Uncharacterized protein n=1 Tax=Patagioenas fasciata monilis TaxID=372326 RepID=A0A1V4K3A0_PATFA|nr:hypothetical protein AV530_004088 [Patagioenas fasciata monilis]